MNRVEQRQKVRQFWLTGMAVALLSLMGQLASAQTPAPTPWATSADGATINNTNPGNVGIGTSNPISRLNIVGPGATLTFGTPGAADASTFTIAVADSGYNTNGANGRNLIIRAGNSDNGYGWRGGDLILNPGAPIAPATAYGKVLLATSGGNVGIGTTTPTAKLHVAGDVIVDGNIAAKYQDVAEWVPSTQQLSAGTVVVLDKQQTNHVLASVRAYDTRVAGVVSDKPGVLLGEGGAGKVMVATTGRVRVRVSAERSAIEVGDLLVTSGKEGYAMRSVPVTVAGVEMHRPGTLIGKALEPLAEGKGEILVLLSLQ